MIINHTDQLKNYSDNQYGYIISCSISFSDD